MRKEEEYKLRNREESAYTISLPKGETYSAAIFKFDTKDEERSVEIGVPINDASPQPAKATVFKRDEEGFPLEVDEYALESDVSSDIVEKASTESHSAADAGSDVVSRNFERFSGEETAVVKLSSDLTSYRERMQTEETEDGPSPAVDPIPPESACPMDEIPCWACKDGVSVVNKIGCGTAVWVICAASGIPSGGLAALGCSLFVGLVCYGILHYGWNNPTHVCKQFCAC